MDEADKLIWIDPPLTKVFMQIAKRTYQRYVGKTEVCNGNIEDIKQIFSKNGSFAWCLRTSRQYKQEYGRKFTSGTIEKYPHLELFRLTNRQSQLNFINALVSEQGKSAAPNCDCL